MGSGYDCGEKTRHDGEYFENQGKWIIRTSIGDEEHTYVIPFDMVEHEYYMCYVFREEYFDWGRAIMTVLYFEGITDIAGKTQPLYRVVEDESTHLLGGRGMVLPFKRLGCQWPPHPGEDEWT